MSSNSDTGTPEDDKRTSDLLALLYPDESTGDADVNAAAYEDDEELAGLRSLRSMFAEVTDEEPPEAVSNKLLAMAAKHAPASKEESRGLFAWFSDLLMPLVAHPGLAAAATLVLVVGVAGTLYVKGGAKLAEPTAESRGESPQSAPTPAAEPVATPSAADEYELADDPAEPEAEAAYGDGAESDLEEPKSRGKQGRRSSKGGVEGGVLGGSGTGELSKKNTAKPSKEAKPKAEALRVKDIDSRDFKSPGANTVGSTSSTRSAEVLAEEAEPPPPPAQEAPSAPARKSVSKADRDEPADDKAESKAEQAARLHRQAIAAAKQDNCSRVLTLGQEIRKLDSGYYDRSFLSDESLKSCRQSVKKNATKK